MASSWGSCRRVAIGGTLWPTRDAHRVGPEGWPMLGFDEATEQMQTGDIVLMHGTFPLSKVIQAIEGSKWTHSGVVIRPEDVGLPAGEILFWESNSTPLEDV